MQIKIIIQKMHCYTVFCNDSHTHLSNPNINHKKRRTTKQTHYHDNGNTAKINLTFYIYFFLSI